MKLILASNSPRRRELLTLAGYEYNAVPSDADEITQGMAPSELAVCNARAKSQEVFSRLGDDCVVIGADTVVCVENNIFGKPKDETDAFDMLKRLSGTYHSVITGCCVISQKGIREFSCESKVKFRNLEDEEIKHYIATGEPMDKAGAYGIQEKASLFAEHFQGDFYNIIGLPVAGLYPILKELGILPQWQKDEI